MAKLIYISTMSLDGYTEDQDGKFDWGAPSDEVSAFINELIPTIGTYLFGRRMYETMLYWETADADQPGDDREFIRIWRSTYKVVYSKTLETVSSARTRIERDFDAGAILQMKLAADHDLSVGGPELAAQAIGAGLVDEFHLFVVPVVLGGGKRALPNDSRVNLKLLEERGFSSGTVYLRYRITR